MGRTAGTGWITRSANALDGGYDAVRECVRCNQSVAALKELGAIPEGQSANVGNRERGTQETKECQMND